MVYSLGGMGGALNGIALGHIDPEFTYSISGLFLFIFAGI